MKKLILTIMIMVTTQGCCCFVDKNVAAIAKEGVVFRARAVAKKPFTPADVQRLNEKIVERYIELRYAIGDHGRQMLLPRFLKEITTGKKISSKELEALGFLLSLEDFRRPR